MVEVVLLATCLDVSIWDAGRNAEFDRACDEFRMVLERDERLPESVLSSFVDERLIKTDDKVASKGIGGGSTEVCTTIGGSMVLDFRIPSFIS